MTVLRTGSPSEVGMSPERIERARELCAGWVKEGVMPALSVCVARRGVIVLQEAFGVLGPGPDSAPLETDSIFPLSSATKPITATLAMQLVEDGVLGLNRRVQEYLPEVKGEGADKMLVHHLLTHTAGYLFHTEPPLVKHLLEKVQAGTEVPPCPDTAHPVLHELNTYFYDAPLAYPPGQEMTYSNINYEFLAEIVRRVSGRAIEDLARERVFDPLGMDDTWYVVPESEDRRVAKRPPETPLAGPQSPFFQGFNSRQVQETPYGGLGVYSTPRDMVTFCQMFLNGGRYGEARILSPATVAAMTRNQIPGVPARVLEFVAPEASWGYGWTIESFVKWEGWQGSFLPLGAYSHSGFGGILEWVDPHREIVGAYFELSTRLDENLNMRWESDLFENVVTAAVDD